MVFTKHTLHYHQMVQFFFNVAIIRYITISTRFFAAGNLYAAEKTNYYYFTKVDIGQKERVFV